MEKLRKFILYLYKKPIKKDIVIRFSYYFFVVVSVGGVFHYFYTISIKNAFGWGSTFRLLIFLLMCMLFRLEGILSFFRSEEGEEG